MSSPLLQTACHDWHATNQGRMVDFAGWSMPVQYSSIVTEHVAVRTAAGLFDIAHMGRLKITGGDAAAFLDFLVTNHVPGLNVGQVCYALCCNEQGGVLDDVLVYRFDDHHMLVVNASNREKIVSWMARYQSRFHVTIEDQTTTHFMLALQGPLAESLLQPFTAVPLKSLAYYHAAYGTAFGHPALVSRTGYTGEDGFELVVPASAAMGVWKELLSAGASQGVLPAGLGCRDTLRLEAAMPLYGHELNEQVDPYSAGLAFAVKLEENDFVGREALRAIRQKGVQTKRVGLRLDGKRIAREGARVLADGQDIGVVTSGTFSPTLQQSIAMASLNLAHSAAGSVVDIDVRGRCEPATIVKLPFYRRSVPTG